MLLKLIKKYGLVFCMCLSSFHLYGNLYCILSQIKLSQIKKNLHFTTDSLRNTVLEICSSFMLQPYCLLVSYSHPSALPTFPASQALSAFALSTPPVLNALPTGLRVASSFFHWASLLPPQGDPGDTPSSSTLNSMFPSNGPSCSPSFLPSYHHYLNSPCFVVSWLVYYLQGPCLVHCYLPGTQDYTHHILSLHQYL